MDFSLFSASITQIQQKNYINSALKHENLKPGNLTRDQSNTLVNNIRVPGKTGKHLFVSKIGKKGK